MKKDRRELANKKEDDFRLAVIEPVERGQLTRQGHYHMPGRRATGIVIHDPNLHPLMKPEDGMTGIKKTIGAADAVHYAHLFTKRSASAKTTAFSPCVLTVNFPPRQEFKARTWYAALEKLNTFLKKGAAWDPNIIDI